MNPVSEDILMHYGMPRRSGRYPWGSGEDPYQHSVDFLSRVEKMRKAKLTYKDPKTGQVYRGDTAIAKMLGYTTGEFRAEIMLCNEERNAYEVAKINSMRSDGMGWTEIGRKLGMSESTVRSKLKSTEDAKLNQCRDTAEFIKRQIESKGMIDIGVGVERELNISKERLNTALDILKLEGYPVYSGRFEQQTNRGNWTTQKVICPKGTPYKEIYNLDQIHPLNEDHYISRDDGVTYEKKFNYPASMDSKRLMIRYNEEGGLERDGIVELRRNVPDLSLGESRYSQVRILVDDTHYIKGMAVYSDDMPDGVDVIFNTNKKAGTPMTDVLKGIKADPDNPFGSAIKDADQGGQYWYDSKTGQRCKAGDPNAKLGLINKRADEGDWGEWQDALPSQFLSKQSLSMAKKQLGLAKSDKMAEYEDICALTNPTIKKHLLQKFSDECDSAAVHLQAAALPRQKYHVIIPVNSLRDDEIYAPGYDDGEKLALIRYPHGGTFEIPIVTVNNKHAPARKLLGTDVGDAVGINSKVAERLSGADFDGDTVMVIPTHDKGGRVKIASTPPLKGLEGFDPKLAYGCDRIETGPDGTKHYYRGDKEFRHMTKKGMQTQMGIVSNLITDMTLAGASDDELAAAVRHSMVVIDAYKHHLDYKQSEVDNNISALHKAYQGKATGGAYTIISKSSGETSVDKRQGTPKINMKGRPDYDPSKPEGAYLYKSADDLYYPIRKYDKATGEMTITTTARGKKVTYNVKDKEAADYYAPVKRVSDTGEVTYTNSTGEITYKTGKKKQQSTKMAETDDAYTLVSDARHPMELIYADYANSMKSLGNQARKTMMTTGDIEYSKQAAQTYAAEVSSLKTKVNAAKLNATRERAAQRKTAAEIKSKVDAGQLTDNDEIKKASQKALTKYRGEVGSIARRDREIILTDREWEAIQAGAIHKTLLKDILDNADIGKLRERATPKTTTTLSTAKINKIKQMQASGRYSLAEIAKAAGVSTSTVSNYLKGVN